MFTIINNKKSTLQRKKIIFAERGNVGRPSCLAFTNDGYGKSTNFLLAATNR